MSYIIGQDKEHAREVCKIGQGAETCRYLCAGAEGLECAKGDLGIMVAIEKRAAGMTAKSDNCDGYAEYQRAK